MRSIILAALLCGCATQHATAWTTEYVINEPSSTSAPTDAAFQWRAHPHTVVKTVTIHSPYNVPTMLTASCKDGWTGCDEQVTIKSGASISPDDGTCTLRVEAGGEARFMASFPPSAGADQWTEQCRVSYIGRAQ